MKSRLQLGRISVPRSRSTRRLCALLVCIAGGVTACSTASLTAEERAAAIERNEEAMARLERRLTSLER